MYVHLNFYRKTQECPLRAENALPSSLGHLRYRILYECDGAGSTNLEEVFAPRPVGAVWSLRTAYLEDPKPSRDYKKP